MVLGSRAFVESFDEPKDQSHPDNKDDKWFACWHELIVMSKKVSQIIAWIWRYENDDENPLEREDARILRDFFIKASQKDEHGKEMKDKDNNPIPLQFNDLLFASQQQDNLVKNKHLKEAYRVIRYYFPGYLPLLDSTFTTYISAQVIYNDFEGTISDFDRQNNKVIMHFPYPPRPVSVTDKELEDWYNQKKPDQKPFGPPNPFIPCSTS